MPYAIEWVEDEAYVRLELSGAITRKEHETSSDDAVRVLAANDCRKLVVDVSRADHKMPVGQEYEFVSGLRSRHQHGTQIAVVVHPDDPADMQLVEDVAQNRGLNLRIFRDGPQAHSWLIQG